MAASGRVRWWWVCAALLVAALAVVVAVRALTPHHPPRAVFIGDSYTSGVGASNPAQRWTTLVSAAEGWDEINLGHGGTGYLATAGPSGCGRPFCPAYPAVVAEAVAQHPDVVVVAGGQNDFVALGERPADVLAAVGQTYDAIHEQLPGVKIVAVGPSTAGDLGPRVLELDDAVGAAAGRVGAVFVDLVRPEPVLRRDMVLKDGAHVDDAGHRAIAQRVEAGLS